MANPTPDVFLSYKAEDRARLAPLVRGLRDDGFTVWWDANISGGSHWREDIEQHLDAAKCVIVVWSKRSVGPGGDFVRDEATRAKQRHVYVPILIDRVAVPLGFGEVQALPLTGWRGSRSDPRYQAVLAAIAHLVSRRATPLSQPPNGARFDRRALLAGGVVATGLAIAVSAWGLLKAPLASRSNSIAVIPFANLSGDPHQTYFSDGVAEEIRSALARLGGLKVIGRISSEAVRNDDARTAAKKLGVANILTGSVRETSSTIRITAELIDGRTGADLWSQDYDRSPGDTIKIQTDIAEQVAGALKGTLGLAARAAIALGGTADSAAQDLILQSASLRRKSNSSDSIEQRLALAEAAITRDPNYARAYVEKADALRTLSANYASTPTQAADQLGQAEAAARKAVAIAPRLGSAHAELALINGGRLDFAAALGEAKQALALAPEDPDVLATAAPDLAYFSSPAEGLQVAEEAITLDPFNPVPYLDKSEVLTYMRRYADAIEAGRKGIALAPENRSAHIYIGDAFLLLGHADEAKVEYKAIGPDDPFQVLRLALMAARTGDHAEAQGMITQIKKQYGATASYQYGEVYAQLGDAERAFAEFNTAVQANDSGLNFLKVDPFLDPIRSDARYAALLRKLNFP